jgi:aldehyde dehydrogenase (NAD+)
MSEIFHEQQKLFSSGATRSFEFRFEQLTKLRDLLRKYEHEIHSALFEDLKKPLAESFVSEFAVVIDEVQHARNSLKSWMKAQCVRSPLHLWPARTRVHREPLGCVLIMAPWNYPIHLTISPLVGALAAGNCAIIKPSELAPATAALLAKIFGEFDSRVVSVVTGGIPETTELLKLPFDHILFTGSTKVGKIVYEAAAKNLTPVTLELGGKSPVIIDVDADIELAARRATWGKFLNAGQTCIAPDYALVHEAVSEKFLSAVQKYTKEFYGENPQSSTSLARIINTQNLNRLHKLLDPRKIKMGGRIDATQLYMAPTLMGPVTWQDPVMQEEIFGPILPYMTFKNLSEALQMVRERDKPLAAYYFGSDRHRIKEFMQLSFGGGCINDTVVQISNGNAPFGGVGASGTGAYHGECGFLTFSHQKTVVQKSKWADLSVRYPPYTAKKMSLLRRLFSR